MMGNRPSPRTFKGKYFLDIIDRELYSTDSYTIWNFYRSMFYGKPFPGEISNYRPGAAPDWSVITFYGRIVYRLIDGKYKRVDIEKKLFPELNALSVIRG